MFINYSQTYASAILSLSGLIVAILAAFNVSVLPQDVEFLLGMVVNLVGVIWTIYHRKSKGDITALGKRV
jgi:hypothetical protein